MHLMIVAKLLFYFLELHDTKDLLQLNQQTYSTTTTVLLLYENASIVVYTVDVILSENWMFTLEVGFQPFYWSKESDKETNVSI